MQTCPNILAPKTEIILLNKMIIYGAKVSVHALTKETRIELYTVDRQQLYSIRSINNAKRALRHQLNSRYSICISVALICKLFINFDTAPK